METKTGITEDYVKRELVELKELLPQVGDPVRDKKGVMTSCLAILNRSVGVARFVLYQDVNAFRQHLRDASTMQISLFTRNAGGEYIASSLLTILNFQEVLAAFAAQEIELAIEIARYMGVGDDIRRKTTPSFADTMGYLLKAVVLNDAAEITKWLPPFERVCTQKQFLDFRPYLDVIQALYVSDLSTANSSFQQLVEGHKRQSKGRGLFRYDVDTELCVWGLGLANLCRSRGLPVDAVPPLIPAELLLPID